MIIKGLALTLLLCFSTQAQTIVGNWMLTSIVLEGDMAYGIATPVTLNIDENGRISGNGGCNQYSGTYTLKNPKRSLKKKPKTIQFGGVIATKMFCQAASNTENAFFRSLREAATVVIIDGELIVKSRAEVIKSPNGNVLVQNTMTFTREIRPKS